jgi:hypothetical protein
MVVAVAFKNAVTALRRGIRALQGEESKSSLMKRKITVFD